MTPEAQRIAIAEACGYKKRATPGVYDFMWAPGHISKLADGWWEDKISNVMGENCLPDYLNDLNAVHEAEKILKGLDIHEYDQLLADMPHGDKWSWHATAAQRCEAFLLYH